MEPKKKCKVTKKIPREYYQYTICKNNEFKLIEDFQNETYGSVRLKGYVINLSEK